VTTQANLFDAPGPRARRRHAVLTAVGAAVALGALWEVLRKLADAQQLDPALWKPFTTGVVWREYLLPGLWGTFRAAALSVVLAGIFGLVFGIGRLSGSRWVRVVSGLVVEFFRAVPVLIMMLFAFGLYATNAVFPTELNPLAAVVTGLTLYNGSVIAELVRSGVHNLPKGQREAGLSVGLTPAQVLRSVELPQALTAMLPALIGQLVVVLKDSALGYQITYLELLNWSKTLGSAYANTIPAYVVAAVLFIIVNFTLTVLAGRVEQRLRRRGRGGQIPPQDALSGPLPPSASVVARTGLDPAPPSR